MKTCSFLLSALVFLVSCGACENIPLSRVCPSPVLCAVRDDGTVYTGNFKLEGLCLPGHTLHDPTNNCSFSCLGFVGPTEELCDHLDNDCDGYTDEDFDQDRDGYSTCGGDCNDNLRSVYPGQKETCNNRDDNCDGRVDEDLLTECFGGSAAAAIGAPSRCRKGLRSCTEGRWGSCIGQVLPERNESCNLIDDDCDGEVDETELEFCGPQTDTGACTHGNQVCDADGESFCVDAVYPAAEICDGLDNDCDGVTDENLERLCQTICGQGREICTNGDWVDCTAPQPIPEICDGLDNDCDGTADEDCPCSFGMAATCKQDVICGSVITGPCIGELPGTPVNCGVGVSLCTFEGEWGPCEYYANEEEICNNWDDDCDGSVDGLAAPCGDPLLHGVGECLMGTSTCAAGMWGTCFGGVAPQKESCNGLDDNCNGEIDEDLDPHDKVDIWTIMDGSGSMCSKALALEQGIAVYVNDFIGTDHHFGLGVYPGRSGTVDVLIPPVDIVSFLAVLSTYACDYGGVEPGWDAAYLSTQSTDPLMIGWRVETGTVSGAYPYVIVITDESASQGSRSEADVTAHTTNCTVGACVPGDRWEFYVITLAGYFQQWDDPTFGEADRLIDIFPVNAQRYTDVLRSIFSNVCR